MPATGNGSGSLEGAAPPPPTKIYIISIGINAYRDAAIQKLQFAAHDAQALADAIEEGARGVPVDKQVLLDAGSQSIEAAFGRLIAESRPNDQFVFFFSGHATQQADAAGIRTSVLLPVDARRIPDPSRGYANGITPELLKAWVSRVQATRQLLIFDTGGTKEFAAALASRVELEGTQALRASGRSIMILGVEGLSLEVHSLGHGQFTFDLLQCLSGAADAFPRDGRVTAGELDVCTRGMSLLESDAPPRRSVSSTGIGSDFDVCWLEGSRGVGVAARAPAKRPSQDEPRGRDYALIIGTDNYASYKRLSNPVNDARTIAADLKDIYGFETRLVENPSLDETFTVLTEYVEKEFSPDDQLFIFIAGHGMYIENTKEGFLIASDSKPRKQDAFATSLLPLTRLRDIVDRMPNRHIFLVIDACFGGTFDQRIADAGERADDALYAEVSATEVRARKMKYLSRRYLTSGGREYVPDGRPGQHSPFARKLLEALRSHGGKEGYLTIGKILQYVEKVTPEPRAGEFGSQEPGGDFVLIGK